MRHDQVFQSIPNVVRVAARRFGDAPALVDGDLRLTFRELESRMVEAVRSALALGIGPGDRVGLCAPNSAEWIVPALGIQGAGGVVVPLNTRFKAAEISYILRKSGAKALFAAASFLGTDYIADLRRTDPEVPALRTTVSDAGRTRKAFTGASSSHTARRSPRQPPTSPSTGSPRTTSPT